MFNILYHKKPLPKENSHHTAKSIACTPPAEKCKYGRDASLTNRQADNIASSVNGARHHVSIHVSDVDAINRVRTDSSAPTDYLLSSPADHLIISHLPIDSYFPINAIQNHQLSMLNQDQEIIPVDELIPHGL